VIQKQNVSPKDWEKLRLEAQILSDLNHPNIVRFKEVFFQLQQSQMVF